MPDRPQCRAITQRGTRCPIQSALSEDGLCLWHDPLRVDEARAARVRGGTPRTRVPPGELPRSPETLDDLVAWSSWVVEQTARGEMDHQTARSLTYALATCRVAMEKRDLGGQLARLQRQLKQLKRAQ